MIEPLTPNTQAILLLTAPLIAGRSELSCDLLSLGDYNRLTRILREKQKQPADLLGPGCQRTDRALRPAVWTGATGRAARARVFC